MKDPIPRGNEASIEYRALLDEITSRELEARTLDTYADDALDDLVALVQRIVETEGSSDARLNELE